MSDSYYQDSKGRDIPRVTLITGQLDKSDGLMRWAAQQTALYIQNNSGVEDGTLTDKRLLKCLVDAPNEYRNITQAASNIGKEVHDRIEVQLWSKQYEKECTELGDKILTTFQTWYEEYKPEPIYTEKRLVSERYAGTCDFYGTILVKGIRKKYVLDWKTSNYLDKTYAYQVAAYRQCFPEAEGCGILRLDKREPFSLQWRDTSKGYETDHNIFNHLVELWWLTHPKKAKEYEQKTKG